MIDHPPDWSQVPLRVTLLCGMGLALVFACLVGGMVFG